MGKQTVQGQQVAVSFDGDRCIHSRHCVLEHPAAFEAGAKGQWMHPDRESAADILEAAHNCPSGAITCTKADGSALETAPPVNTIRVMENGPLAVRADLQVGGQADGYRATLCRCGQSANKPYCDNSHVKSGFVATGEPAAKATEPLARRDGTLSIEPTKDGPYHVMGNVELLGGGSGRPLDRTTDTWLCRCGHSQNKPYCDGSHAKVGFQG